MSARDRILARLRAAPAIDRPTPDVGAYYDAVQQAQAPAASQRSAMLARIRLFRRMIEAAHAEVHPVSDADWPAKLQTLCHDKQLRTLLLGEDTVHGERFAAGNPVNIDCRRYYQPIDGWKDHLFHQVDAAFTAARSAIAETGTLIVWPDAKEPRLMSLVPPVHFVLLDATAIHTNLFTAMQVENWPGNLPTNALLISGPSKTADIQQTLAYGAHGPKELVILLRLPQGLTAADLEQTGEAA
jgi:L-lactate dehydrogenase complex protein LldG